MLNAGDALMGMGEASGEARALKATEMAMNSPLLEDMSINGARGVLVNITGGKDMTMHEINDAMTLISNSVSSEANVFFGQVIDESLENKVKVTIIATNFDRIKNIPQESGQKINPLEEESKINQIENNKKPNETKFNIKEQLDFDLNLDIPAYLRKNKGKEEDK
jgi:cell division protein FtsZ